MMSPKKSAPFESCQFPQKERLEETIFLLFIQISWNNGLEKTSTTLLDNDLDLLLPFKQHSILAGFEKYLNFAATTLAFGFSISKHSLT